MTRASGTPAHSAAAAANRAPPHGPGPPARGGARARSAGSSSLAKIDVTWRSTARSETNSASAMPRLERPAAIPSRTSRSRGGQRLERAAAPADHRGDDLRVQHRPAAGDAGDRGREALDLGDPVLEQVADARRAALEQLARVALLEMRGEHEHAHLRELLARMRAACRPSSVCSGGMRTSTMATSGRCARTLRSRSSRSPAWPTTSKPDSSSSRTMPARSRTESSPTTTRSGSSTPGSRRRARVSNCVTGGYMPPKLRLDGLARNRRDGWI